MNEKIKQAFEENGYKVERLKNKLFVLYPFGKFYRTVVVLHADCKMVISTEYYQKLSFKNKNLLTYLIQKQNDMLEYEAVINFE